jgi:hypothetical protein
MHGLPDLLADRTAPVDLGMAVLGRDLLQQIGEAFFFGLRTLAVTFTDLPASSGRARS